MVNRWRYSAVVLLFLCAIPWGVSAQGKAPTGVLKVNTRPSGASVQISGKMYGPTPVLIELAAGKHSMTVTRSGYPPVKKTVFVSAGRISVSTIKFRHGPGTKIRVHNTKAGGRDSGPGTVNLSTQPSGLTVFMNGLIVPQPTPVSFDIRAGIYELTIEQRGEVVFRKTMFVRAGRTLDLDLTIKRRRKIDDTDPWK